MKITFVQTGGTIDKEYPRGATHHGYNFEIGNPAVNRILAKVSPAFEWEVVELLRKDSLDITDEDRVKLADEIASIKADMIVVTHGTDTIHLAAKELRFRCRSGCTIVFTGAMLPERFIDSDAMSNLGMAVGAVQTCEAGSTSLSMEKWFRGVSSNRDSSEHETKGDESWTS